MSLRFKSRRNIENKIIVAMKINTRLSFLFENKIKIIYYNKKITSPIEKELTRIKQYYYVIILNI